MAEESGKIDFVFGGETYQTWYKVVGNLHSGVRPVVALHGGPGIAHLYMLPHTDLFTTYNIPVVFYDQIGIGRSSHVKDKPKEFWTMELFMSELDNLLSHLGISDNFDLLGHSWGGMLAAEYVTVRRPTGLKRLILADTLASMELWEKSVHGLLQAFPQEFRDVVKKHEDAGTTSSKEYQDVMMEFYQKHVCRVDPWPEDLQEAFGTMEEDPTVYHTMLGPSEFNITGTLKTWSVIDRLHTINYPTLVINGAFDEGQDVCILPLFEKIPKVKWVQFANSSHTPFFEERERYMRVVGDFLTKTTYTKMASFKS